MKNYCIIPVLIFLLFMLVYQCSGQDYVVTSKRDTIRGDVKPLPYGAEKKVQVVTSDKQKTIFPITQTIAFFFKGETFHPVRTDKGYVFMKLLKDGYLSLYAFQLENQITYDGRYLIKRDGTKVEVPNLGFKKIISNFLADCEEVSARIEEGQFAKREIDKIIDAYNRCVEGRTAQTNQQIARKEAVVKKSDPWTALEEKVKAEPEFEGKKDALDMITDIKGKISRSEKVPNFLLEGLRSALSQSNLKSDLDNAIREINN